MGEVEQRLEAPDQHEPNYAGWKLTASDITDEHKHRDLVGGRWDQLGQMQLDFLVQQGMEHEMTVLDVGCGSLRAGTHLVDYLDPSKYYGVDINKDIIETGYHHELTDEQRSRLPIANLRATDRFDVNFGVTFDMAVAQSLFTHISLNRIRLCLYRVAQVVRPGGRFFATFFEARKKLPVDAIAKPRRYTEMNPYWY